jgi:hypothetical protein
VLWTAILRDKESVGVFVRFRAPLQIATKNLFFAMKKTKDWYEI